MYVGIDIGHTNLKAVAFDSAWNVLGEYGIEAGMEHPSDDRHEIPIDQRWELTLDCLDELLNTVEQEQSVSAIGLAGGGGGLYPLDADREPFINGIPLLDGRSRGILERWKEDGTYRAISEITGIPIPPGAALASLRWLKEHRGDDYDRIEHVLNLKDVVRYKLTGELALELSDATFSFTNHETQRYDDDLFELAGVTEKRDCLPNLHDASYNIAGHTTDEVEAHTGISKGTPVIAGAHDACANTLGVGAIEENIVATSGGTWSLSTLAIDTPSVNLDRWCCENFLEENTWMLETAHPTGTISLDWFVDEFFQAEKADAADGDGDVFDILEGMVRDVETNVVFHPYLFGNAYGYLYQDDASGSFIGLTSQTGRAEMLRAIYEAIAFMHRWQIEQYDYTFGVEEVRFTGGASKSNFWAQLFADVIEKPISTTKKDESGCFGAAMLAAIGTGDLGGLEETTQFVEVDQVYEPQNPVYRQKYETFKETSMLMESSWNRLADLRRESRG